MVKTIIINGSPRAPKSNSKLYAEIFQKNTIPVKQYLLT